MATIESDYKNDFKLKEIQGFKDMFGQYVDELLLGEHIEEVANAIKENESNYNNCDPTSRQKVYDSSTIREILEEILKIERPDLEDFLEEYVTTDCRDEAREELYKIVRNKK